MYEYYMILQCFTCFIFVLAPYGYAWEKFLGRGHFATAHVVTRNNRRLVAKVVSLECLNENDQKLAHQEVKLLQKLKHEYIVSFEDSFLVQEQTLVILMEFCEQGELRHLIKERSKKTPPELIHEDTIMMWFCQLTMALQYMHALKVLHRDLKSSNIFVTQDLSIVKLGDFGISRVLEGTVDAAVTVVGTPYYMSPEICRSFLRNEMQKIRKI